MISGASTGLNGPRGVAVDSAGQIFVANTGTNTILIFAPGANGNVAPVAMLTSTQLGSPVGASF